MYRAKYEKYKAKYLNLKAGYNSRKFDITLQQPWLDHITSGKKTVEGRLNKGVFKIINIGDTVKWFSKRDGKSANTKITKKVIYPSFQEMLEGEGLLRVLPGIKSIEEGVSIYRKFYSEEDEKQYGVIAFTISI